MCSTESRLASASPVKTFNIVSKDDSASPLYISLSISANQLLYDHNFGVVAPECIGFT